MCLSDAIYFGMIACAIVFLCIIVFAIILFAYLISYLVNTLIDIYKDGAIIDPVQKKSFIDLKKNETQNNKTIITFGYLPYEILESSDDLTAELRTLRNLNIKNDLIPKGDNQYLFKINAPIQMKKIKTMITLINEHFQNTMFKNNANNITIYFFYTSLERNFHDVEFFKDKCIKYIISKNKILFQEYCDNGTLDETNTLQNQDFETPFCLKNETKYMNCIQTNELTHSDVFEYPKTFSNILHNFIATIFCGTQATNKISFS